MRLKSIGKLCTQRAEVDILQLIDENGIIRRYVGDGCAFYEVGELGDVITLDIMYTIFDVKKEDRGKWSYRNSTETDFPFLRDEYEGEEIIQPLHLRLKHHGLELVAFRSAGGVLFINADYLAPMKDEIKDGGIGFYRRPGQSAITVKNGMCKAIACIALMEIPASAVDALFEIYRAISQKQPENSQKDAPTDA